MTKDLLYKDPDLWTEEDLLEIKGKISETVARHRKARGIAHVEVKAKAKKPKKTNLKLEGAIE